MEISLFTLAALVIVIYLLYQYSKGNKHYFHDKPICYRLSKPRDTIDFILKKYNFVDFIQQMYNTFPDAK